MVMMKNFKTIVAVNAPSNDVIKSSYEVPTSKTQLQQDKLIKQSNHSRSVSKVFKRGEDQKENLLAQNRVRFPAQN